MHPGSEICTEETVKYLEIRRHPNVICEVSRWGVLSKYDAQDGGQQSHPHDWQRIKTSIALVGGHFEDENLFPRDITRLGLRLWMARYYHQQLGAPGRLFL